MLSVLAIQEKFLQAVTDGELERYNYFLAILLISAMMFP
jgi:hypothetical protein